MVFQIPIAVSVAADTVARRVEHFVSNSSGMSRTSSPNRVTVPDVGCLPRDAIRTRIDFDDREQLRTDDLHGLTSRSRLPVVKLTNHQEIMPTTHEMYDEAVELKNQGDLEAAVAKLREILEIDPEHIDTHSALAVYLQKMGQFEQSIEHAKRVCEIAPNDPFSHTQLSVIYVKCGLIQEAEDARAKAHEVQAMNAG